MKWIPIAKAKVKFDQPYLLATGGGNFVVSKLIKTEKTESGMLHHFYPVEGFSENNITSATHIAIITDPSTDA